MIDRQPCMLHNSFLSVAVVPAEGGRVSSLRCLDSELEFLTQAQRTSRVEKPTLNNRFQDGACAGIEECLPTVGVCGEETEGGAVPDHGDFWQIPWAVTRREEARLCLEATGFSRPLHYRKELSLEGRSLIIQSQIENAGTTDVSFLYACHPLFAVEARDRVVLSPEVSFLNLYYSRFAPSGAPSAKVSWPGDSGEPLDVVRSVETGFAAMFYTRALQQGFCGLYRSSRLRGLAMRFDPQRLPYLGLWLCYGGWPDDAEAERQYAVALEPTFAPCNTLQEAQLSQMAKRLRPKETTEWEITFEISPPGVSLEQFTTLLRND
jgi:galactose mutarotase-like enzyme